MPAVNVVLPAEPIRSLDAYRASGGGEALDAASRLGPDGVIEELEASGLRGRGGAGFPTGRKWRSIASAPGTHRYVACNAAEGEPATFKDREILRRNPYQVIEGLAVAAAAVGAREAYIGIKASFERERAALTTAAREMADNGLLGGIASVTIVEGPEEYLFGEETGLLEVIEGGDPLPRLFPPYVHGLFSTSPQMGWSASRQQAGHEHGHESNPTLVNNVETLANVTHILANGAGWFRQFGTPQSPGTVVVTVVGDVTTPLVVEVPMGTPLSDVLDLAGGPTKGRRFKAALSGVANPFLPSEFFDANLTYEAMDALGTGLGAAGFAVYDDSACMVALAALVSRFLYVESCNQCPPCKFGSGELTEYLARIEAGEGTEGDLELMHARLKTVTDGNRCYLPVQEQRVVSSLLQTFPEEVAAHLDGRGCPLPRRLVLPKIVDLDGGEVVYDEQQQRKRPDWTYADEPILTAPLPHPRSPGAEPPG
ncbi:MAG TPA: NADH-ubiquinone oxidoreductase-F iron-sulfur binding region domain-containing protein [Acidimicrobiia bacterium]|nr:NADH-ubiquinone oxidoreductase-F iron-sulfur binding region domain-containing protein [Acidimicrobiia bacterium]